MWKLIWYNISRRRNQSMLTVSIVMLIVMIFTAVLGATQVMSHGIALSRQRLGADVVILPREADADGYSLLFSANPENVYMSADVLERVSRMDGIAQLTPQFYAQTLDGDCCSMGTELRIVGIEHETDFVLQPYFKEREFDRLQLDQAIYGGNIRSLVGEGTMILGRWFQVVGALYPTGTGMDDTVFMDIDVVRDISRNLPELQELWETEDPARLISVIMVRLEDGTDPEAFADTVNRDSELGVRCITTESTITVLSAQLEAMKTVMLGVWVGALLIAGLALLGRFNALAKDRKKEIGLMRAIGVQKGQVFVLILGEADVMALLGGLAGALVGCLCVGPVLRWLQGVFSLPTAVWNIQTALLCGGAGVLLACLLGFLAAVYPAARSAGLEPQTAIAQGELN